MAQSLSKIYIHLIFHIKTTSPAIIQEDIEHVHCYVGQLVNTTGSKVVRVGGVNDHVHHKRFSFQDEYRQFLLSYGVEYYEAYVFKN